MSRKYIKKAENIIIIILCGFATLRDTIHRTNLGEIPPSFEM